MRPQLSTLIFGKKHLSGMTSAFPLPRALHSLEASTGKLPNYNYKNTVFLGPRTISGQLFNLPPSRAIVAPVRRRQKGPTMLLDNRPTWLLLINGAVTVVLKCAGVKPIIVPTVSIVLTILSLVMTTLACTLGRLTPDKSKYSTAPRL